MTGRTAKTKERLIAVVTQGIVSILGVEPQSVRVLLTEIPAEHWGVGGESKGRKSKETEQ